MLTLTNRIDMRPGAVPLVIHLGQYDSDFSLVFELYSSAGNFTVESGTTAMIRGTKTDGNAYDADATIDVSAKTVTVAGSEQMTAAKGRNVYELVLTKSGKVLSTANFILDVERAAMDADTIASESVLKELNAIIAGADAATEAAQTATAAAESVSGSAAQIATNTADIATNTSDIADLKADLNDSIEGFADITAKANFTNASLTTNDSWVHIIVDATKKHRVSTTQDIIFSKDTMLNIEAGFMIYPLLWDGSAYVVKDWNSGHFFVPKNTRLQIIIARITESTSEVADIDTFVSKVTFETYTSYEVQSKIDNDGYYVFDKWMLGNWSNTGGGQEPTPSAYVNNRARMPYGLLMPKGSKLVITANGDGYFAYCYSADGLWTPKTNITTRYTDTTTFFDEDTYVYIVCRNTAGNALNMSNLGVTVAVYSTLAYLNSVRVTALESLINGTIADYYQTEMATTVEAVRSCLTEPCLVMPLITDIHRWQSSEEPQLFLKSIQNINYFKERVKCDGILNLGDNTEGDLAPSATIARSELMLESFMSLGLPYYQCIGNHDDNRYGTERLTLAEMYRAYMSPTKDVVFDSNMIGTNFYKDFDDVGIRMICANSNDNGTYAYTEDTYNFITSALNTDKTVIFCSHISPIYSQNYQGTDPTYGNAIKNTINSFITNGGKLIQLCGHSHADYSFTSPYLSIFSDCNKFENFSIGTRWPSGAIHNARTQGTATEDCWSILVVRPLSRKINLIRFGAGSDREFNF